MGQGMITRRGIDTSDATATAADIVDGKTAYAGGEKLTGNFDIYGEDDFEVVDLTGYALARNYQCSGNSANNVSLTANIPANSEVIIIVANSGTSAGYVQMNGMMYPAANATKVYKIKTQVSIQTVYWISNCVMSIYYKAA